MKKTGKQVINELKKQHYFNKFEEILQKGTLTTTEITETLKEENPKFALSRTAVRNYLKEMIKLERVESEIVDNVRVYRKKEQI